MKSLVAYYSRTGITKKIAISISTQLKADIDEIIDEKNRSGAINYITAGKDAMKNSLTKIKHNINPKDYDLIIIGGPVWAWTMSPAIRTYLDKNSDILRVKKVAFFATQGSSGADKKFIAMQEFIQHEPVATLTLNGKDFRTKEYEKKLFEFIHIIKQ